MIISNTKRKSNWLFCELFSRCCGYKWLLHHPHSITNHRTPPPLIAGPHSAGFLYPCSPVHPLALPKIPPNILLPAFPLCYNRTDILCPAQIPTSISTSISRAFLSPCHMRAGPKETWRPKRDIIGLLLAPQQRYSGPNNNQNRVRCAPSGG